MKRCLAALSFLTVLPLPGVELDDDDIGGALPWFSLVGIIIGGATVGAVWVLLTFLPPWPVGTMAVIIMIACSGGLHMDGLADTADAFFSARPRERMLEIMRDSRIGTMGVIAIVVVFMLKLSCLTELSSGQFFLALLVAPVAGRSAMVFNVSLLPYVRDTGLAKLFFEKKERWHMLITIWILFVVCGTLMGLFGLIVATTSCVASAAWGIYCLRKIGGATGDTLGACCEVAETVAILTVCARPALEKLM